MATRDALEHPRTSAHDAEVRAPDVRVERTIDLARHEARARFGGVDLPAVLAGVLAAIGTAVVLAAILGAIGAQLGIDRGTADDAALGGAVAGILSLVLSFFVGGWVAGRMARYDGGRNGLLAALVFLVLVAASGALAASTDGASDLLGTTGLRLPADDRTAAIATAVAAAIGVLVAGFLGGRLGARYHRRADALVAGTRGHALQAPTGTIVRSPSEGEVDR